jgi:hypothetical protein
MLPQQVAGGNLRNPKAGDEDLGLSALANPGRTKK